MFDQLYMLARGGVCIYSGPPQQIKPHLDKMPNDMASSDSTYPIEALINYSCLNHNEKSVQMLVQQTESQWSETERELSADTQLALDGVQRNRRQFSLRSTWILFRRYVAYFRGHLWPESAFFTFNYLIYGFSLRYVFDKAMIYDPGCLDISEDDTSTCQRNQANVEMLFQLINNFKFIFFFANFFQFFWVFQCSMSMLKEWKFFTNEHRNGKRC